MLKIYKCIDIFKFISNSQPETEIKLNLVERKFTKVTAKNESYLYNLSLQKQRRCCLNISRVLLNAEEFGAAEGELI